MIKRDEAEYLTVREVAQRLSVSRSTVYRLIARGHIPAVRVGARLRVPAEYLMQLKASARPNPNDEKIG